MNTLMIISMIIVFTIIVKDLSEGNSPLID